MRREIAVAVTSSQSIESIVVMQLQLYIGTQLYYCQVLSFTKWCIIYMPLLPVYNLCVH